MSYPKARKDHLRVGPGTEGGLVVYDERSDDGHVLNPTSALVFELADGTRSVADLAGLLAERTGLPADEEIVVLAVQKLDEVGLLESGGAVGPAISRRTVLARLALGAPAAVLLPDVRSVTGLMGGGGPMITICHKPGTPEEQTMVVSVLELPGHLLHGDKLGQCPQRTTTGAPGSTTPSATTTPSANTTSSTTPAPTTTAGTTRAPTTTARPFTAAVMPKRTV